MSRYARFAVTVVALGLLTSLASALGGGDGSGAVSNHPAIASSIVVGFTGGFVRHDNPHHGPVLLARRIQKEVPPGTFVQVFENRHRKAAYKTILRLLDRDHDGFLSEAEKAQARIVLYGHSWGASAVVLLARELDHEGIPVLLTVQVDSVAKLWQKDGVIPDNVVAAANFYQPNGFIHGRSEITAADASKTHILGNYRFDYSQTPIKCEGTSWFDRAFMWNHIESNCDPRLWNQVETLVEQRIHPEPNIVATVPSP